MRRRHAAQLYSLLAASVAIAGCPFGQPLNVTASPTPGIDTGAEKAALATILDTPNVHPYFEPGKLINDGIGIFSGDGATDPVLPRRWGRSYPKTIQSGTASASLANQMEWLFRTDANNVLTADATFSISRPARFVAEFPWQHSLVTKSYTETALRTAEFQKRHGTWSLIALSPMALGVKNPHVSITQVRLTWAGQTLTVSPSNLINSQDAPVVPPSQAARIEVKATSDLPVGSDPPYYLFLSRPPGREHVRLLDDGHGQFAANFNFAATTGPGHLVVDAVSGPTFSDLGNNSYDAQVWGISYLVQGGGAQ